MQINYYPGSIVSIPSGEHEILALLHHGHPVSEASADVAILRLHGMMGNLLDETESYLSEALASHGIASMTINTLLSNLGLTYGFGVFEDAMPQVATACRHLRHLGFNRIVVAGHGLGACMAVRYASLAHTLEPEAQIDGMIAVAVPWSLPDTVRERWRRFGSEPSYDDVCNQVARINTAQPNSEESQDRTILVRRAHGRTDAPSNTEIYTLKTWQSLVGPEAEGTMPHKHIGDARIPMLLVSGTRDTIVASSDINKLASCARESGEATVQAVHIDADHTFTGKHDELSCVVVDWIEQHVESKECAS